MTTFHVILLIVAVLLISLIVAYFSMKNKLVRYKNSIKKAKSSLDAYFVKRQDLIPNLLLLLKQYMGHEKEILERVADLRSTPKNEIKEETATIKSVVLQAENYPELKANEQFLRLMMTWNDIEDQIAASRRYIVSAITSYNDYVQTFPSSIVASMLNYETEEYEQISEEQKQRVDASEYL